VIAAIPDGTCHECRRGWQTVCPNQERIGYRHDGGFAELMRSGPGRSAACTCGWPGARGAVRVVLVELSARRLELAAGLVAPD
jgi:threonine dehydrogenase-like Zn-dependent dehydrogenase